MLKKHNSKITMFFLCNVIFFFFIQSDIFAAKKQRNWRFGISRYINSIEYSYKTKRRSVDGGEIDTSVKHTNNGLIYSTGISLEYIFGRRKKNAWFGIQFEKGLSMGNRYFTFIEEKSYNEGKTKIGDIHQKLIVDYLMGINFFFPDATDENFNFSLGLLSGQISVNHKFKNGGQRDDDFTDSWMGLNKTQTSTHVIPLNITKLGMEYVMETGGVRLDILSTSKKYFGINDLKIESSDNLGKINNLTESQTETISFKGAICFSIFNRF